VCSFCLVCGSCVVRARGEAAPAIDRVPHASVVLGHLDAHTSSAATNASSTVTNRPTVVIGDSSGGSPSRMKRALAWRRHVRRGGVRWHRSRHHPCVGEFDMTGTGPFWGAVSEVLGTRAVAVTVEPRGLTFIDSLWRDVAGRARDAATESAVATSRAPGRTVWRPAVRTRPTPRTIGQGLPAVGRRFEPCRGRGDQAVRSRSLATCSGLAYQTVYRSATPGLLHDWAAPLACSAAAVCINGTLAGSCCR
jgi:hypothetical protein